MADAVTDSPINLRRARKARAKAAAKARADENAMRHGRSRAERRASNAERDLADRNLDGARIEPDDTDR